MIFKKINRGPGPLDVYYLLDNPEIFLDAALVDREILHYQDGDTFPARGAEVEITFSGQIVKWKSCYVCGGLGKVRG